MTLTFDKPLESSFIPTNGLLFRTQDRNWRNPVDVNVTGGGTSLVVAVADVEAGLFGPAANVGTGAEFRATDGSVLLGPASAGSASVDGGGSEPF